MMGENSTRENHQVFDPFANVLPQGGSDGDGHLKRKGTFWIATTGSAVLCLAWATAQLGWIAGPAVMLLFSCVTYYTSTLLADCYRSGDPVTGNGNFIYMDAVRSNLGDFKVKICGWIQFLNLFGVTIGYTITASISMKAIKRSNCFHASRGKNPCRMNSNPYTIAFGIVEIICSQIHGFEQLWWLSIVAVVMSFTYSTIGLGLGIAKVAENGKIRGSLTGISVGTVSRTQKMWGTFQALGDIAFAYSYSHILNLNEIQDILKAPPSESKTMKKAPFISAAVTTLYILCGFMGYAAFGDMSPSNLLTGFGFYNPFWLLDIANVAVVIHLVGEYQVYCQPLFAFVEKKAKEKFPDSDFFTKKIQIPGFRSYNLTHFGLVWRTTFVILTTLISMFLPFKDMVGLLGAFGFWPLTVYFPVEMYISQKKIPKWSKRWVCLQILSVACLIITVAAAAGSVAGFVLDLKAYKPFSTDY